MNIKGIQKTSLVDFPGRLSTVLFSGGCNLSCKFCHNPELACNSCALSSYSTEEALEFLNSRQKLIDGVVISGGEPTLSRNIDDFITSLKASSLAVKIDTNGFKPDVIERLLSRNLLDYIAIDIKTSPDKYPFLTDSEVDFGMLKKTVDIVRESGVDYEIRTTCIPYYVTQEDFVRIKNEIGHVKKYYLQQFINSKTLDSSLGEIKPYTLPVLQGFLEYIKTFSDICGIRGASSEVFNA